MASLPYFPFYPSDWLASPTIQCATLEQQGAYLRLLCACWLSNDCAIPNEPMILMKLSGLPEQQLTFVRSVLVQHPTLTGHLTNMRLLSEFEKAQRYIKVKSQAGKKSGKSRRTRVRSDSTNICSTPVCNQNHIQNHNSSSSSSSEASSLSESEPKKKKKDYAGPLVPACETPAQRVWARYQEAYQARYGTAPVRNGKVNGQIAQLVKRIGVEAAPEVAAFYVRHNDQYYVANQHPIGLLLQKCEGLHTQWARGDTVTSSQARRVEKQADKAKVWREVAQELEEERRTIDA